jgi:membrane associated rhomboid family serine protease
MCRSCGSIVGSGQQQCAVCGTPVSGTPQQRTQRVVADHETLQFARAVLNRPYKFTIILLAVNIFFFTLMWQTSGMSFSLLNALPMQILVAFGAKVNSFISEQHQWWRFVTPMFLHVNLLHLLVNMYSLWMIGPYVEKLYGSAKFVFFWVATGICGVLASYLTVRPALAGGLIGRFIFKAADEPSAGASGALFGLVGVLFIFGIKFRHELPEGFKRAFGTGLLPMILMNLFIGYLGSGFIDNAAHLGGFVSGALLALVVDYRRPGERSGVAIVWRVLQIAAIAIVVFSFVKIAQHLRDPIPAALVERAAESNVPQNAAFLSYVKALTDGQEAFVAALKDHNTSNIDAAVNKLDQAPRLDQTTEELKGKLKSLLLRAKEPQPEVAAPAKGKTKTNPENQLVLDFMAWQKEYNSWLKSGARTYSGMNEVLSSESPE